MLGNKSKKIPKKEKCSEENMQTLKSWIQKLEQTTNSVSSRLKAVESRISIMTDDSKNDYVKSMLMKKKMVKDENNDEKYKEIIKNIQNDNISCQEKIEILKNIS